ncbi:MAG: thioredoxin family protein [Saprospirales bacterium]|nr:MAG: thioredoxin family protein [Saprospirales bacterium]
MKNTTLSFILFSIMFLFAGIQLHASDGGGLKIGDVAPDFSLKNIDGNYVSMSDYEDAAGFIIIFSCNHCPFVVAVEDRMIALHERYAPMGWHLIAINPNDPTVVPDDSFEKMIERAQEKNFPFPYVKDVGQKVFPQYGATRTPHVFLLDSDKVVRYIGAIDDNTRDESAVQEKWLENAIARIMRGMDPDPLETRAIGCTIKVQE